MDKCCYSTDGLWHPRVDCYFHAKTLFSNRTPYPDCFDVKWYNLSFLSMRFYTSCLSVNFIEFSCRPEWGGALCGCLASDRRLHWRLLFGAYRRLLVTGLETLVFFVVVADRNLSYFSSYCQSDKWILWRHGRIGFKHWRSLFFDSFSVHPCVIVGKEKAAARFLFPAPLFYFVVLGFSGPRRTDLR